MRAIRHEMCIRLRARAFSLRDPCGAGGPAKHELCTPRVHINRDARIYAMIAGHVAGNTR